jgi:DNA-binding HxlR family transcriptional regulator
MVRCPYCGKSFRPEKSAESQPKRKALILEHLNGQKHAEKYYNYLRLKGYPMKRKTFQRDLKALEKAGLIEMEIFTNKCGTGRKTYIKQKI